MGSETGLRGVTALDHTADVGIEVEAPSLPELLTRSAAGMIWLLQGGDGPADRGGAHGPRKSLPAETRTFSASAANLPELLREWLRELLFWYEVEGLAFADARFDELSETGLKAEVTVVADPQEPVREIKGVTLHGLVAELREGDWVGRVIFDV